MHTCEFLLIIRVTQAGIHFIGTYFLLQKCHIVSSNYNKPLGLFF